MTHREGGGARATIRLQSHKGLVGRSVRLNGKPTHPSSHPVSRGVRSRSGGGTCGTWYACIAFVATQESSLRQAGRWLCREKRREEAQAVLSWYGEGGTRCPEPQGCRLPAGVTGRAIVTNLHIGPVDKGDPRVTSGQGHARACMEMQGPCAVLSSRSCDRAPSWALVMLERRAVQVACAVLRGQGGGDTALLPGDGSIMSLDVIPCLIVARQLSCLLLTCSLF